MPYNDLGNFYDIVEGVNNVTDVDTTMINTPYILEYENWYKVFHGDTGVMIDCYPKDTVADTKVCQQIEVDKTMFDEIECTAPSAPRVKARTQIANAQIIGNVPVEATQRDYATQLIGAIAEKHNQALRKQFHMDNERPKTAEELIAAIKGDAFILDTQMIKLHAAEIKRGYFNNEFGITWGSPPDTDGYEAAKVALKAAAQKALTGATLKSIDALEGVIGDFEAWVYTPAA